MRKIIILTDYKGYFGSKWHSLPYRSGYDQTKLAGYFQEYGYSVEFIRLSEVEFVKDDWNGQIVLYTSSEEPGYHYKSYIEDVILGLERLGAILIPSFDLLKANNNKVYMEVLRQSRINIPELHMKSITIGTFEELEQKIIDGIIPFPCVLKKAEGSMSRGVYLAKNEKELKRYSKKISRTKHLKSEFQDQLRQQKHKGYAGESKFQGKFIIQPFISGLTNDWKVLIYWDHYYILKRHVRKNDFRASGSGINYKAGSEAGFPTQQFKYLKQVFNNLDTPNLSIDFAYDGKLGYILEFQGVFFGTSTQYKSKDYFLQTANEWRIEHKELDQEGEFVYSIVKYMESKGLNK